METIHKIELIQPIKNRWSPRVFAAQPIPPEILQSLFEAARWAPSSYNAQPWRFIVANRHEDLKGFEKLANLLYPKNKAWAQHAPVLFLSLAEVETERGINRHAWHDVGLATGNLLAQATAHDIFSHQIGGFHRELAIEELQIPKGFEPVAMVALGYRDEAPDVNGIPERDPAERNRKHLSDIVFTNNWKEES